MGILQPESQNCDGKYLKVTMVGVLCERNACLGVVGDETSEEASSSFSPSFGLRSTADVVVRPSDVTTPPPQIASKIARVPLPPPSGERGVIGKGIGWIKAVSQGLPLPPVE